MGDLILESEWHPDELRHRVVGNGGTVTVDTTGEGSGTFDMQAGTLDLNGNAIDTATYYQDGGTITGSGTITVSGNVGPSGTNTPQAPGMTASFYSVPEPGLTRIEPGDVQWHDVEINNTYYWPNTAGVNLLGSADVTGDLTLTQERSIHPVRFIPLMSMGTSPLTVDV